MHIQIKFQGEKKTPDRFQNTNQMTLVLWANELHAEESLAALAITLTGSLRNHHHYYYYYCRCFHSYFIDMNK